MVEVTLILHASEGGMKGTGKRRWPALTISTGPQHFSVPHPHTIVKRSLKDGIVPRGMSSGCQLLLFISVPLPPTLFCHFVRSLPPSLCPAAAIRQTPFTVRRPPRRRPARARRFAAPTDSCFRSTGGPSVRTPNRRADAGGGRALRQRRRPGGRRRAPVSKQARTQATAPQPHYDQIPKKGEGEIERFSLLSLLNV